MGSHLVAKCKEFQKYSHFLELPFARELLTMNLDFPFDVLERLGAQNCLI